MLFFDHREKQGGAAFSPIAPPLGVTRQIGGFILPLGGIKRVGLAVAH